MRGKLRKYAFLFSFVFFCNCLLRMQPTITKAQQAASNFLLSRVAHLEILIFAAFNQNSSTFLCLYWEMGYIYFQSLQELKGHNKCRLQQYARRFVETFQLTPPKSCSERCLMMANALKVVLVMKVSCHITTMTQKRPKDDSDQTMWHKAMWQRKRGASQKSFQRHSNTRRIQASHQKNTANKSSHKPLNMKALWNKSSSSKNKSKNNGHNNASAGNMAINILALPFVPFVLLGKFIAEDFEKQRRKLKPFRYSYTETPKVSVTEVIEKRENTTPSDNYWKQPTDPSNMKRLQLMRHALAKRVILHFIHECRRCIIRTQQLNGFLLQAYIRLTVLRDKTHLWRTGVWELLYIFNCIVPTFNDENNHDYILEVQYRFFLYFMWRIPRNILPQIRDHAKGLRVKLKKFPKNYFKKTLPTTLAFK